MSKSHAPEQAFSLKAPPLPPGELDIRFFRPLSKGIGVQAMSKKIARPQVRPDFPSYRVEVGVTKPQKALPKANAAMSSHAAKKGGTDIFQVLPTAERIGEAPSEKPSHEARIPFWRKVLAVALVFAVILFCCASALNLVGFLVQHDNGLGGLLRYYPSAWVMDMTYLEKGIAIVGSYGFYLSLFRMLIGPTMGEHIVYNGHKKK